MTTGPSVAVLDYGSGNLRSVVRAMEHAGADVELTSDYQTCLSADGLVVPGVGAFEACMAGLRGVQGPRLIGARLAGGRPVLGICVGMQVLFDRGIELGVTSSGCGEWPGTVERLEAPIVPHMGWNTVESSGPPSRMFAGLEGQRFYFVHSYAAYEVPGARTTTAEHGEPFAAAVEHGALSATQFHPEKSGDAGAGLLANWLRAL